MRRKDPATTPGGPDTNNFIWIPPGTFTMGSPSTEEDRGVDEGPQTLVTISKGFWMSKYELTQAEYVAVVGVNPSDFSSEAQRPVETVSWADATNYCAKLTTRELTAGRLATGYEYRLPTEAEWEYACRAGTITATAYGESLSSTQANFNGVYPYGGAAPGLYLDTTTKVGAYAPNAWGLYDMHGNVWEWCSDWYARSLPGGEVTDPKGPATGENRVLRGGGWRYSAVVCRSAARGFYSPAGRVNGFGIRLVLAPGQP